MTAIGPGPHTGTIVARCVETIDDGIAMAVAAVRGFVCNRGIDIIETNSIPITEINRNGVSYVVGWDVTVTWEITP